MRLWNYVSTFSNLSGERLHQIYSKLKQEQGSEGVGPSYSNGSIYKGQDGGKFEAWKRRRRAEGDTFNTLQQPPRPAGNGAHVDPNSLGILGAAPPENKRFRMHQSGFSSRQGFSSGIR